MNAKTLGALGLIGLGLAISLPTSLLASLPAATGIAATPGKPIAAKKPASGNWNAVVTKGTDGTYTLGNPDAPIKLTEYVSYTCPHCAHFSQESDAALRLGGIQSGQVSVRVSVVLRNALDATVALLINCGDDKRFFARNQQVLATQDKWIAKLDTVPAARQTRWSSGAIPDRMRAIASDLALYDLAESWGLSRARADRCLTDTALLETLHAQHSAALAHGLEGTPSFDVNGDLLGVHDWGGLSKDLNDRIGALRSGNI